MARVFMTMLECKTPGEQLSAVLRFYRPLLKNKYDDVQRRGRDLEHLQTIAKRYKTPAKLLDDIALDPSEATAQENAPRRSSGFVTLSTVHSAKGLEWDHLFVIWMTDGWFPFIPRLMSTAARKPMARPRSRASSNPSHPRFSHTRPLMENRREEHSTREERSTRIEQVRKRGLPPLIPEFNKQRGQAPLPDLF
jgi:superfamily I DNA/RNA helicase